MKRLLSFAFAGMLILWAALPTPAESDWDRSPRQLKVMTRNLYVGANLFQILGVPAQQIPFAAAQVLADVVATNFPERAQALALEVKRTRPDLIGLQEVSLIRTQTPSDFGPSNPLPNANDVLFDYLEILLAALSAQGLHYEVVASVNNADIEVPFFAGLDGEFPLIDDVRLTDRDVILARKRVRTRNAFSHRFGAQLVLEVGGIPVEFTRSFVGVHAWVRGRPYLFVNTHLEVGGAATALIQAAQAAELIQILSAKKGTVVAVGDFNSGPTDPSTQPYTLMRSAGYADMWTRRVNRRRDPGFTCCEEALLQNPVSLHEERIDLIFVRNDLGTLPYSVVGRSWMKTLGDRRRDKTPSGLWPSDHAGVFGRLFIPRLVHGRFLRTERREEMELD